MSEQTVPIPASTTVQPSANGHGGRWALGAVICLLAVAYTIGVVTGSIPSTQKIDATNLVILGAAGLLATLLVKPQTLERLKRLKLAGFELELEKLKQQQEWQRSQLEAVSLLLPLVLSEAEATHLRNLAARKTAHYEGSHGVRSALRSLCAVGLTERMPGRKVAEMKDNLKFDLADFLRLTPFGRRMVAQLEAVAKAQTEQRI